MINKELLKKILEHDIIPTLTDMENNQYSFWEAFDYNLQNNVPIKNILELGIMRLMPHAFSNDLPGQSTKILFSLADFYNVDNFISLDIDPECIKTIEYCKKWVQDRGIEIKKHEFVKSNSIEFDVEKHFPNGIDFIFLDTNHDDSYPEETLKFKNSGGAGMTYREICYYAKHLTENGRLFLHDTKNYYVPRAYGVNTEGAIQRFLDENNNFLFKEHDKNRNGLGEIYRKGSIVEKQYGC